MLNDVIEIKKLREEASLPVYGTGFSAGADLFACLKEGVTLNPGESFLVPTGLAMKIPDGYVGLVYARSGLASKRGLAPANMVGVIDSDYRGEIMVALRNYSNQPQRIEKNERIAQIVFTPYLTGSFQLVDSLDETKRGAGGFGSTGKF